MKYSDEPFLAHKSKANLNKYARTLYYKPHVLLESTSDKKKYKNQKTAKDPNRLFFEDCMQPRRIFGVFIDFLHPLLTAVAFSWCIGDEKTGKTYFTYNISTVSELENLAVNRPSNTLKFGCG